MLADLLRTLSNQDFGLSLERLVGLLPAVDALPALKSAHGPRRARYRSIERACLAVIATAGGPISVQSVHAEVELILRMTVSYSSVKNAVARLADKQRSPVRRLRLGVYEASGTVG